ncbi:hypothetical protein [Catalinimonas alkaloidigena]|nr:hypothetical protein [Catalinimonas alkaloidigena]
MSHELPPDEKPPFFRTWPHLYTAVLIHLVALVLFFYWFTHHYN